MFARANFYMCQVDLDKSHIQLLLDVSDEFVTYMMSSQIKNGVEWTYDPWIVGHKCSTTKKRRKRFGSVS